jgi:hypothetical protein
MSNQLQITGDLKVKTLTGALTASAGVVSSVPLGTANGVATLGSDGKVPSAQLPTMGSSYKGTWNASTNTPTIADGVGTAGDYYLVSTGGTWNGIVFLEGNTVIYSGTVWQKAGGGSGTVTSVGLAAPAAFSVSGSPVTNSGTLTLAGAGASTDYIKGDGTLAVFNSSAISAVSGSYLALAGGTMTGQIVLKESSSSTDFTKGLRFPNDPFIGSGDISGLRLYADTTIGPEAQVLELYIANDGIGASQDRINLQAPSNDLVTINGNKIWNAGNLNPANYLPLSGGTLTGALSGTSATFSGDLTIDTNTLYVDSTNNKVGIGTTTPDSQLVINGSSNSRFNMRAGDTRYGTLYADNGVFAVSSITSIPLVFGTNDIEKMRITSGGNVLIGTTTDNGAKLNVNGSATFASSVSTDANLTLNNGTLYVSAGSGLSYSSRLSTAYNFPYVDTYLDSFGGASYEGRLNFRTNSGGGAMSTKMTILNNGSVGIGTSTPSANLSLSGSGDIGVRIKASALSYIDFDNADSGTPNGSIAYNNSTNIMTFSTGGSNSEKARITSTGSLLIGSETDLGSGYKLQVNGSISMAYANFFNFKGSTGVGDVIVDNSGSSLRVTGLVQFDSNVTFTSTTLVQGLLTNYNVYNTQTSSYTLVLSDASKIIEMNVGSANTVTIPTNASVAFPVGTEITVMQYGAGITSIAVASGVTIVSKDNANIIANRYTGVTLVKRATNEWYLIGNIVV